MKRVGQKGFSIVEVVIVIVIVGLIGAVGWRLLGQRKSSTKNTAHISNQQSNNPQKSADTNAVLWTWDNEKWTTSGTAPACASPVALTQSPTDVTKATAVLYPGQIRGGNYKPHGGFIFKGLNNSDVAVVAPMDAKVVEASRYIEAGEIQYMFDFINDCGLAYRLDHLLTLSPKFQALADSLPAAKVNDSQTHMLSDATAKAGELIASAVGFNKTKNVSFDLGVYDLRQRNQAAQSSAYVAAHQMGLNHTAYAICWFDALPSKDASIVKTLPGGDATAGKTSDYCK